MAFLFGGSAKLGKDLILESDFRTAGLETLHRVAAEYGYEILQAIDRSFGK